MVEQLVPLIDSNEMTLLHFSNRDVVDILTELCAGSTGFFNISYLNFTCKFVSLAFPLLPHATPIRNIVYSTSSQRRFNFCLVWEYKEYTDRERH